MQTPGQEQESDLSIVAAKLRTGEGYVRVATLAGLLSSEVNVENIVDAVAACLSDSSLSVRELAVLVLGRSGKPAVNALIQGLSEKQPLSVRIAAASGLSRLGAEATPAVGVLCKCLESPDELLRWHSALALSKIGKAAIPSLLDILVSLEPAAQSVVVDALGWMGADARDALRAIKGLTSSPSPWLQLSCHGALIKITKDIAESLPKMLTALRHQNPDIRRAALQRVGELREIGRASASNLLQCLEDPSSAVRAEATLTLARIEAKEPESVQALIHALRGHELDVRSNAAIALSHLGPEASPALPLLVTMQNDKDLRIAAIANASIQRISGAKN